MCGILAIYLQNKENNLDKITNGYTILQNRGPDTGNIVLDQNLILGFRRLAIMDMSELGNQPFVTENGNKLICNGEIFNHKDIINKYNLICKSQSDCESILHLFNVTDVYTVVQELNGDFAFILYSNQKIFFARDRIGVRPLFFGFTQDNNFAMASYARALSEYCPDVKPVPPGWGIYDIATNQLSFFEYQYPTRQIIPWADNMSYAKIKQTLEKAVIDRLMSDRPIGCLLSGGLDSSLIASILSKHLGPKNVRTYSIGMKGSQDLHHAKIVADYLGTVHTEIVFEPTDGFKAIPDVIRDLESYDITTVRASVGMWLLCKYIRENTDDIVLYSGEGADELFCGYLYFHYAPTPQELGDESRRLIKNLHWYDVLRADRCVSSHGLELRVPFLDRNLVELSLELPGESLQPKSGIEKHILRSSFASGYLPDQVLWRRKDGLSDGVSGNNGKRWYEQIQEFVDQEISDGEFQQYHSNFPSKEAYYYKKIFDSIFPNYKLSIDYWLPKWVEHNGDPSGRKLKVFADNTV
jgi:asparagine synthase (glutamine-hydrolysing)